MKNSKKFVLKYCLFILLGILLFVPNVKADELSVISSNPKITIKKVIQNVDSPIEETYHYTLTEKSGNPANVTGLPSNIQLDVTLDDEVQSGQIIVTKDVNLGNANFTKLGNYYFVLTEEESGDSYDIVVSIRNEVDADNKPTGSFVGTVMQYGISHKNNQKEEIIFYDLPLTYLTLRKKVSGDMGNVNEYFKFELSFENGDARNVLIQGQDANITYHDEEISTSNYFATDDTIIVYLKNNQEVLIGVDHGLGQLDSGWKVNIKEIDSTDYETYINNSSTNSKEKTITLSNDSDNNIVSFENVKNAPVLSGVITSVLPYIILISISVIGLLFIKKRVEL